MYKTIHLSSKELTDVLDALDLASRCCTERMDDLTDELPGFREVFQRSLIDMSDRYDKIREAIGKGLLGDEPVSALSSGEDGLTFKDIQRRVDIAKLSGLSAIVVKLDWDGVSQKLQDAGYYITKCGDGMYKLSWEK